MLGVIVLEMSVNPFRTLLLGIALAAGAEELKMKDLSEATFAGGCFWCLQPAFDNLEGVASTSVGYTGGKEKEPNYEDVAYGRTGHREAIRVKYDPDKVGYEKLLDTFWKSINPTQADGQFADIGPHYRTAIFYHDQKQREAAEKSKGELSASGKFDKPIATEILPASEFYAAEGYHQEYYKKNPGHYERYKIGSGRAGYIEKTWGKE
ncbi:MAG: peptide-methionine (S)-S-oxide reductase [Proteobacteria bacterium]|nr:MAG: peptide-methionine (S)-S-oxide reductase [Pseudomonadota bacterium]